MKRVSEVVVLLFCVVGMALADSGILLPRDKSEPDPAVLSLNEMEISVAIDNGDARVYVRQIFANHTRPHRGRQLRFCAAQPRHGAVDFAVWDGADTHSRRSSWSASARARSTRTASSR